MAKETLCIAYCGDAVDSGVMDVNALAPALLALGDLLNESNKLLNNDGSKIQVYIKSDFRKGSFEIGLEMARTLADQLRMMFGTQEYSVADILQALGLFSTLSGLSVFGLIQWLKGRKIDRVVQLDKDTRRVFVESEYKDISVAGLELFRSYAVRGKIEETLAPLREEGIDAFEVRDKETRAAVQHIAKEELDYFKAPEQAVEEKELITSVRCFVHISSVNFEKDLKWRFDNGELKFFTAIEDGEFLSRVDRGDVLFAKGLTMEVELKTKQKLQSSGIKTEYIITKVYQTIGRSEQLSLNFTEE